MSDRTRTLAASSAGAVTLPDDSVFYTWTCPFCGASRTSFTSGDRKCHQALNALKAHVSTSDGNGHGQRNAYPEGFDPDRLVEQISFEEGSPV